MLAEFSAAVVQLAPLAVQYAGQHLGTAHLAVCDPR